MWVYMTENMYIIVVMDYCKQDLTDIAGWSEVALSIINQSQWLVDQYPKL